MDNKRKKERVAVAMSGGVDSSVAAAMLKKQGFEVVGLTMCFSAGSMRDFGRDLEQVNSNKPSCCGVAGINDARRVAEVLGIRHYVLSFSQALKEKVVSDFLNEYSKGRTPNPCVRCNQFLKFDILLKKALGLGARYLATGHYARIGMSAQPKSKTRNFLLKKAKDKFKDQSYFLYRLNQEQLKHILFPLGGYTKQEVRAIAKDFGLGVADKPGSQEICFLPDDDYRKFIKENVKKVFYPGDITDMAGRVIGRHQGIAFYTIGQRQGFGIALGYPAYVVKIDPLSNRIVLGRKEDVYAKSFSIGDVHFVSSGAKKEIAASVKIRYNQKETPARIYVNSGTTRVVLAKPQFAVTPGQSAVFYQRDTVLGGGIIEEVVKE